MAKEMMIVFVYDTECCQNECDDPVNAVLYFHPSWVSDIQKLSLCGQLMGTTHFLQDSFAKPKIISLQSGRFVLKEFGRFILAVGTDRNISKSVLEHRADILTSLVKFFHRDIQTMHDQFTTTGKYKNLSEKLYHIFETYLPILQYNGNLFQNMPISRLPKSASNIYLDAMQTLHICQQTKGVLGGTILYHNKVVVTQLSPEITKNLIITDPYRIKSTAEIITVDFHVPNGVQLIVVFIPIKDYRKLLSDIQRAQNIPNQNSSILPFQFKKKVKRDKSIIFTDIPEEGYTEYDLTNNLCNESINENNNKQAAPPIKCVRARPTHLPLRFKNVTSRELPESGFNSINFDESDSFPQFIGRTSVCSTPMTENKLLHANVLSICANPDNEDEKADNNKDTINNEMKLDASKDEKSVTTEIIQNSKVDNTINKTSVPLNTNTNDENINQDNKIFTNYINNPFKYEIRRNSFNDLHNTVKKISRRLSIHPFGINLAKLVMKNKSSTELHFNNYDNHNNNVNDDDDDTELDDINKKIYHTINDPTYPVFNSDGAPISKYLFQEFLERQYQEMSKNTNDDASENVDNTIEGFDSEIIVIPSSSSQQQQQLQEQEQQLSSDKDLIVENSEIKSNIQNSISLTNRKSLTLPLKSLTTSMVPSTANDNPETTINEYRKESMNKIILPITNNNLLESPAAYRKKSGGIQLTPLMSKLTVLAANTNDERSSGFSSWDTTPGLVDLATPIDVTKLFRRRSSVKYDDIVEMGDGMQKVELFICGQQNMTLILLLEENSGRKQELVQSMFDTCVSRLTRMELHLNQILNVNVDGDKSDGGYSFISLDQNWDTLQRCGPWSLSDLNSIECIRNDFSKISGITDLILRSDDSVLYGYKYSKSGIFYKQTAQQQKGGLPPPADLMGTIPICAKRRLERDHSIILL